MILISDSGSSKTDWCWVDKSLNKFFFQTIGLNPYNTSLEDIKRVVLEEVCPKINFTEEFSLYFYGAGCSSTSKKNDLILVFKELFQYAKIEIYHDLLGAARAVSGNKESICGILGTGSNSCLYDGRYILNNIPALGYVLCDEGGGTDIGKRVLTSYLRGLMPEDLSNEFYKKYPYEESEFLNRLYKRNQPNYYLASFARFPIENISNKFCEEIIYKSFKSFFENQIILYPNYNKYNINIVGSIGFLCKELLIKLAQEYRLSIEKIIKSPISDLVDFHINKL